MNGLHWIPEEDKIALANIRRNRQHIEELKVELADFRDIFWSPAFPEQKTWAGQMIKSIEHELDQLG